MITIPEKIRILGKSYIIEYVDIIEDNIACQGQFISQDNKILIKKSLKGIERDITILHELIHLILNRTSLDYYEPLIPIEETIVDIIAKVLAERFNISYKS